MKEQMKQMHEKRGEELASQMTVPELISQLMHKAEGIPRLGIRPYNWWNEALHGVARAGTATVFPQAICMAASFSEQLLFHIAEIISDEARAKYNESQAKQEYGEYRGLTMWSPNINIYRDPRWGRGQETYGEDPYLTGLLGAAFIRGLQGNHEAYIKTAACAKHFAVHSGPEAKRHEFNAVVSKKDMMETYLPAFRAAVNAGVCGVMGAYNRVNGEACCASDTLIQTILRKRWGFDGYFVSDCGALPDIVEHHHLAADPLQGASMALNAGCELECGAYYRYLPEAYSRHYISKETLQRSVARLMGIRSRLGMFDKDCPYNDISPEENATPAHEAFAVAAAEKGLVLLENNGLLPLQRNRWKLLVVGYNGENDLAYLGNYFGEPTAFLKVPEAVRRMNADTVYAQGYSYIPEQNEPLQRQAVAEARKADVLLFCSGLDCSMEGEEAGEILAGGGGILGKQGDRLDLELPQVQKALLEKLIPLGKKIVLLNFSSGCIRLKNYKNRVDAILQCWYPGARGGQAIANLLFGVRSPSGRLPVTFYNDIADLPDFEDYAMQNRTYRYFQGDVQYPFGYGLSYTAFQLTACEQKGNTIFCTVKNTGDCPCDEVLQLYVTQPDAPYQNPLRSLIAVRRFSLLPQEEKQVAFDWKESDLFSVDEQGNTVYLHGRYLFSIWDGQHIDCAAGEYRNEAETRVIEECPF